MKIKRIALSLIMILCSFCGFSSADETYNKAGTTSATFLKISVGARATGMGEAACAASDDANAIYWNPAGLALLECSFSFYSRGGFSDSGMGKKR